MYKIDEIKMLRLGQRDENISRSLTFDCSDWLEQYPEASIHILFRRPGESAIVPMSTTMEGTTLTWLIHDFEVGKTGVGNAEFRAVDTAGLRRKSRIIPCSIEDTLLGDDETVLYTQDQVDETLAHISEAAQAAIAAKASEEAAALSAQEAGESATSASAAASVATSARDAAQAAQTAAETAQHQAEAAQSGVHADAVAAEQAKVAAQAAQASAQGAASQASADRTAAESARADAEAAAEHAEAVVEGIDQAGADQVAAVNAAGQAQVSAVNAAGTTQVGNVNTAGATQVSAVQAKGTQVINSIPADYSALTDEVTDLKSAIDEIGNNFDVISSVNLYNVNDPRNVSGKYVDGQGWHDQATAFTSYPFLLKAGVKYTAFTVSAYGSGSRYLAKKCDADGNLESGSVRGTAISGTDYGVFQSQTDQYVYFKFTTATKNRAMIVYGETAPTEYQPYFEPYTDLSEDVQVLDGSLENVTVFARKDKMPYVSTDIPLQYEIDMDGNYTKGWLKLPSNYTPSGKPVPLIVFVHGSADMISIDSSMTGYYNDYYNYLRDCGYALFDCYAYGNLYAVAGGNTWNTPTNKKCYHQGIEYVCKNYNIDRNNIFVACKSLGGVQAFGFYFDTTLNIKAIGMLAPFLDPVQICGGYTVVQRTAYRDDCGLPSDPDGVFINNTSGDALITYLKENGNILLNNNPAYYGARKSVDDMIDGSRANTISSWRNNTECEGIAQRPLKIWVATDDTFYSGALNVCNSLKAGGYGAEVRAMPAGCSDPHHAVDTDPDALQTENVTTRLGVVYESIPTAYYELGKWFDMWLS